MTELLQFDQELFRLINSVWTANWLDHLMPVWRSKLFWVPLYVFLFGFLLINFRKKGLYLAVFAILTITVSDTLSSKVIKKSVERIRPCNSADPAVADYLKLRVPCGGGYSFTSSHATNHFALAFFLIFTLGKRFKWIRFALIFWAGSIAYGQVYVGVHYPLDVVSGAILGILVGALLFYFYKKWDKYFFHKTEDSDV